MGDNEMGMSPMREAAVQLHEMYIELKRAGFSRTEAMELIARVMGSAITGLNDD